MEVPELIFVEQLRKTTVPIPQQTCNSRGIVRAGAICCVERQCAPQGRFGLHCPRHSWRQHVTFHRTVRGRRVLVAGACHTHNNQRPRARVCGNADKKPLESHFSAATPSAQPSALWSNTASGRRSVHGAGPLLPLCPPPPPCVTFRLVVVPLRGPGQSPVLPFACCVGSLLSVGRCGRCSCWCCFRFRGAQWLVYRGCAGCGMVCRLRVSGAQ